MAVVYHDPCAKYQNGHEASAGTSAANLYRRIGSMLLNGVTAVVPLAQCRDSQEPWLPYCVSATPATMAATPNQNTRSRDRNKAQAYLSALRAGHVRPRFESYAAANKQICSVLNATA